MSHDCGLWPIAPEFEIEDKDLVLKCEACDGTGSIGFEEHACPCRTCSGRGALPLPSDLGMLEPGHA